MNISMNHNNPYNVNLVYNDPNSNMNNMFGNNNNNYFESTMEDFSRAASDIACYNDNPSAVFSTLRSVARKLLKNEDRYRTLDTTNPRVMERLIGYEGVLDFLMLLGFESDAIGMKLVCHKKPSEQVILIAIYIIDAYIYYIKKLINNNQFDIFENNKQNNNNNPFNKVVHNAITVLNSYQQRFAGNSMNRMMGNGYGFGGGGQNYGNNYGNGHNGKEPMSPNTSEIRTQGGFEDDQNFANTELKNDELTLEQIVIWGSHESMHDNDTMETLIMTHEMFTDSLSLLKQLRKRFFVPIPQEYLQAVSSEKGQLIRDFQQNVQKPIQLKSIKALRFVFTE